MYSKAEAAAKLGRTEAEIDAAFQSAGLFPPEVIDAATLAELQEHFGTPEPEPVEAAAEQGSVIFSNVGQSVTAKLVPPAAKFRCEL